MIAALGPLLDVFAVVSNILELPIRISLCLVIEMWRLRIAALAACQHALGANLVTELDDGNKAVAARAVDSLGTGISLGAE